MGNGVAAELPAQPTSFVGRDVELDALASLVRSSRLVTITGASGMGKTRLAIELAARLVADGVAGVRFVSLAPLNDPAFVAQEVASRLGVRERADEPVVQTLRAH